MTIIKHRSIRRLPVALPAIAGIEMWERFSFYGMQAILAYYLYSTSGGLGMDQAQATALVGAYGSLLYLCTFCLLYTSPSPRDKRQSRMPSSA